MSHPRERLPSGGLSEAQDLDSKSRIKLRKAREMGMSANCLAQATGHRMFSAGYRQSEWPYFASDGTWRRNADESLYIMEEKTLDEYRKKAWARNENNDLDGQRTYVRQTYPESPWMYAIAQLRSDIKDLRNTLIQEQCAQPPCYRTLFAIPEDQYDSFWGAFRAYDQDVHLRQSINQSSPTLPQGQACLHRFLPSFTYSDKVGITQALIVKIGVDNYFGLM